MNGTAGREKTLASDAGNAGGGAAEGRIHRKPSWLRKKRNLGADVMLTRSRLKGSGLHTVCEAARCPNLGECFARGVATFMVLGERCTRNCRFCAVDHGEPRPVNDAEGDLIADYAEARGLSYLVITSVTRDDLLDGGASHFARTVLRIRSRLPSLTLELLVPDFQGSVEALRRVAELPIAVLGHNLETTRSLYGVARKGADYDRSLKLLERAKRIGARELRTKSGIMIGLGESARELDRLFGDLAGAGVDILTVGQYLRPSRDHLPVRRYYRPEEFEGIAGRARSVGIGVVVAGPYVRSSYRAAEAYAEARERKIFDKG